jgi:hypothetical protein
MINQNYGFCCPVLVSHVTGEAKRRKCQETCDLFAQCEPRQLLYEVCAEHLSSMLWID